MAERVLKFRIFRYDPADPGSTPHLQEFDLAEEPGLNLFVALNRIRETLDPSLKFDFVCRAAICGSCGMLVNGAPRLACRTLTADLPAEISLLPLPAFKLIGDLSVDTGSWFREMNERVEGWMHEETEFDPDALEMRMDNQAALDIYEQDRCIECGCCIAACTTTAMRPGFLGAAGLNRIARFMIDPRDGREGKDFFELVATADGVYGCLGLMGCQDFCPKELPLQVTLAYLRRIMARALLSGKTKK